MFREFFFCSKIAGNGARMSCNSFYAKIRVVIAPKEKALKSAFKTILALFLF